MMRNTHQYFRCIALLFFLFYTTLFSVKAVNLFNQNCHKALSEILQLNYSKSSFWISKEKQSNPDNIYIPYLESYSRFVKLILNEVPADFKDYTENVEEYLNVINGNTETKDKQQLLLAQINLFTSVVYAKFNDKYKAFKFLYAAQKNILSYKKLNPSGIEINKVLAVVLQINSYLPGFVKNLIPASLTRSNPEELFTIYRSSVSADTALNLEANILRVFYIDQFSTNLQKSYQETKDILYKNPDNPLLNMGLAFIASRSGNASEALSILTTRTTPFICEDRLSYLQYFTGVLMLNTRLDGKKYFEKFLSAYQGNTFKKSAWLKLGWICLLSGDTLKYLECKKKAYYLGTPWNDNDAAAQNEAKVKSLPNLYLLKARLYFDGGLYNDARLILLDKKALASLRKRNEQIEYLYRIARINHVENVIPTAKKYYAQVIDLGKNEPHYFAANAALQLGSIFEQESNFKLAQVYYQQCLDINKYEYASSIGAKARAGLIRVTR